MSIIIHTSYVPVYNCELFAVEFECVKLSIILLISWVKISLCSSGELCLVTVMILSSSCSISVFFGVIKLLLQCSYAGPMLVETLLIISL